MQTQVGLTLKNLLLGMAPHPHHCFTSWHEEVRAWGAVYLSGALGVPNSPTWEGRKVPLTSTVPSQHLTSDI